MIPVLSTTARVVHDLGLATGFGGSLFGKLALRPAVRQLTSIEERTKVVATAWKGFSLLNLIALAGVAATWITGRTMFTRRRLHPTVRRLVFVKDALLGTTVATGLGSMVTGYAVSIQARRQSPTESSQLRARVPALQRASAWLGTANIVAAAGAIGLTTVLATKFATVPRPGLLSRWSTRR